MDSPLFAPWRMEYIRSLDRAAADDGCFLCAGAAAAGEADGRQRLVLWQTPHSVVMVNRFPYNNGHLLIAPRAHKAELEELDADERCDLTLQTAECVRLLKRAVSAQGFNIGINLGRCAGAGLPGHLHQHVGPRWAGDAKSMRVVGDVRVVPKAMGQLYDELVGVRASMLGMRNAE